MRIYWSEGSISATRGLSGHNRNVFRLRALVGNPLLAGSKMLAYLLFCAGQIGVFVWMGDGRPWPGWGRLLGAFALATAWFLLYRAVDATLQGGLYDRLRQNEASGVAPPTENEVAATWAMPTAEPLSWSAAFGLPAIPELRGLHGLSRNLLLLRADEAMLERWLVAIPRWITVLAFAFSLWATYTGQTYQERSDGGPWTSHGFLRVAVTTGLLALVGGYAYTYLVRQGIRRVLSANPCS